MNNFERAQMLAANALAEVDDLDIERQFRSHRLSGADINHILRHVRKFENDVKRAADPSIQSDE